MSLADGDLPFESRRSPVLATGGMVATSQPLAAQAGLEILQAGGNAADAAVASAAALGVVEPTSTGLGGDCFALYFNAASGEVEAVNGSGRAPAGLTLDFVQGQGLDPASFDRSVHAVTVPGAAAGWADTLGRFGRLDLADALAPAIRLAEQGFPVSPLIARSWAAQEDLLREASPQGGELLIDGRAPRPAELWTNPGLANVMHELAEGGADAYYEGRAATAIVDALASLGGRMSHADLAGHRSTFEPPISTTYRGHRVYECSPNGQGLTALIALNILEGFDVAALPARSTAYLHTAIEALRLAFADARTYIADPEAVAVPTAGLLAKQYAADRRQLIDPANATADPAAGSPLAATDTVYLSAVDGEGNACSFINSNCWGFGTGIVPAGCGFSLQNRGTCFRLTPGHPNALGPNKRPYHTIIPAVATRADGSLFACFGVMGGFHQPQGHVQVLVNLIDRAMDPQSALDEPRFSIQSHPDNDVYVEESVPEAVRAELRRMGHSIVSLRDLERAGPLGKGQIIVRDPESGVLIGGSDPRGDGAAVGF